MMNTLGISTDELNERLLKASELLKPLGIGILCEIHNAELESRPKGIFIKYLDVRLEFSQPLTRVEDLEDKSKDCFEPFPNGTGHPGYAGTKLL